MLHVLMILLKILGILLLLFVGVLLLVLLVPLRYSFSLEKGEQVSPEFSVRVTWLCWLFYFKASYIEKVFDYRMRILGHQVAGNQKEFLEKQKKKTEKAQEKRKKDKENRKKKSQKKEDKEKKPDKELPVTISEQKVSVTESNKEEILKEKASEGSLHQENIPEESVKDESSHKELPKEDPVKDKVRKSVKQKRSFFKKSKDRIKSLKDAKSNLDKLPWREWLELGRDKIIRLFKHIFPQKLKGTLAFGFSDPADTGYITGIAAIFYPKYGESFSLYPNFERRMFEAQCEGRGRIRLGYILVLVVSILKEKSVRAMIKNIISG